MPDIIRVDSIDQAIAATLMTVAPSSQRIYQDTYNKWIDWCHNHRISPLSLHPANILQFLVDHRVTRTTRKRQLSSMRKLVAILAASGQPTFNTAYEFLKMASLPTQNLSETERNLQALSPEQANRVLAAWPQPENNVHTRNRALLAFMLAAGARRSEVVVLEWRDLDLGEGTAIIRHGKGDKQREVSIVGDYAIDALGTWRRICADRRYVFCRLDNRGRLQGDLPMSVSALYKVVKQTEKIAGVVFSPHDARRTLATELLASGASTADVQEQLGHANAATTLRYAQAADARTRRQRFKTRYGDE